MYLQKQVRKHFVLFLRFLSGINFHITEQITGVPYYRVLVWIIATIMHLNTLSMHQVCPLDSERFQTSQLFVKNIYNIMRFFL